MLPTAIPASAQSQDIRDALLYSAAKIETQTKEGMPHFGFGLIVARDGEFLWIATARHVAVWPNDTTVDALQFSPSMTATWLGAPRKYRIEGAPRRSIDSNLDLAFFAVRAPLDGWPDRWYQAILRPDPAPGETVQLFGGDHHAIKLASRLGSVVDSTGQNGLVIANLCGVHGQSGSPVVSALGIVGLYTGSATTGPCDAIVIPIEKVRDAAGALSVPWHLSTNVVAGPVQKVCVRHLGVERPSLLVGANTVLTSEGETRCGVVSGGKQQVRSVDTNIECQPLFIFVDSGSIDFAARCVPTPAAYWSDPRYGGASVSAASPGVWMFNGLSLGPAGAVRGRLTGQPPTLMLDASTESGTRVIGSAHVLKRELELRLNFGGGAEVLIVLRRP